MVRIDQLPAASSFDGTELFPIMQGGVAKRAGVAGVGSVGASAVVTALEPSGGDDRANLQAAIDEVSALGGGTVQLRVGTYLLASRAPGEGKHALEVHAGTGLIGAGVGATIVRAADSLPGDTPLVWSEGSDIEIAHFTIDGNKARFDPSGWGVAEDEGIDTKGSDRVLIHHMHIKNCGADAIDLDNGRYATISDCILENNGGNGVHISGDTGVGNFGRTVVANCISIGNAIGKLANNGDTGPGEIAAGFDALGSHISFVNCLSYEDARGFVLSGPRNVVNGCTVVRPMGDNVTTSLRVGVRFRSQANDSLVVNSVFEGQSGGGYGVEVLAGNRVRVSGCTFNNGGIRCAGSAQDVHIESNQIASVTEAIRVLSLASGSKWKVSGNYIRGAFTSIRSNVPDGMVTGNMLVLGDTHGITLDGSADRVLVEGNRIIGPSTSFGLRLLSSPADGRVLNNDMDGGISESGTGHIIKNNVLDGAFVADGVGS